MDGYVADFLGYHKCFNVLYDIDIEPWFYYWGYTWPLHQGKSMIVNVRSTSIMHISLKSWTN